MCFANIKKCKKGGKEICEKWGVVQGPLGRGISLGALGAAEFSPWGERTRCTPGTSIVGTGLPLEK